MLAAAQGDLDVLREAAMRREVETVAVGSAVPSGAAKFVVRELVEVPEEAYLQRTAHHAVVSPEFCVDLANRARAARASVVFAHTHVGHDALADFSAVDDTCERLLATYFNARVPHQPHFAMLVTPSTVRARQLGTDARLEVRGVGRTLTRWLPVDGARLDLPIHARQVLAFGQLGQQQLEQLTIAVIGLGGTGSVVAQQLAHLGVRRFILIDLDLVEATNLNRLVGGVPGDVGRAKVDVARDMILAINPHATCTCLQGDVVDDNVASQLLDADVVMGCTDSMASRAVLNQLAYQHLVPCIDLGVQIKVSEGRVESVAGRVQMLAPGLPCLVCANLINAERARVEFMTPEQRLRDAYVQGSAVPQPAVISLNSTVASAAVTMLLGATIGFPTEARWLSYDAKRGSMRSTTTDPVATCPACSAQGALCWGDDWPLPTRLPAAALAAAGSRRYKRHE